MGRSEALRVIYERNSNFSVFRTIVATTTGGPPFLLGASSVGFLLRFGIL